MYRFTLCFHPLFPFFVNRSLCSTGHHSGRGTVLSTVASVYRLSNSIRKDMGACCVNGVLTDDCVQEAQLLDSTQATQAAQLASNPHFMHDIFSRRLMNAAAATVATDTAATPGPGNTGNSVKLVKDAVGFVDAIAKNYAHIVVEQHLNLDNIPAENENLESLVSTGVPATVLSITVRLHLHVFLYQLRKAKTSVPVAEAARALPRPLSRLSVREMPR